MFVGGLGTVGRIDLLTQEPRSSALSFITPREEFATRMYS